MTCTHKLTLDGGGREDTLRASTDLHFLASGSVARPDQLFIADELSVESRESSRYQIYFIHSVAQSSNRVLSKLSFQPPAHDLGQEAFPDHSRQRFESDSFDGDTALGRDAGQGEAENVESARLAAPLMN